MARPKGKLLALVAIFVAVGLVTATGAFTTVTAERTATVEVSGDNSALLGIDGVTDGDSPLGDVVTQNSGVATIDLSDAFSNSDASGINLDATTQLDPLVVFANNGDENLHLTVEVTDVEADDLPDGSDIDSEDIAVITGDNSPFTETELESGSDIEAGLKFNFDDIDTTDIQDSNFDITITATAESVDDSTA